MASLPHESHRADLCVVGGGLAGMCAAIAAARHGAKVVLMHDRPVLGGNASSEVRMWVSGAHGENNRETGILDEIHCENQYRNPLQNYPVWDSILYEKVRFEPHLTLLLNCSCNRLEMDGARIASVTGWQTTTQTWHTVTAELFADCSGDSILAPLSGAEFRVGREAADEFGEDIEPAVADRKTMGMSCLIQLRETDHPHPFVPPPWANKYPRCDDLPHRSHDLHSNFWWIELGGEDDSIRDTERLRDELLKAAFGVWDHLKNHCAEVEARNWVLDWVGFLPGKRESRRYVGDHILTQNDVRSEGRFADLVAYGGWSLDDHHPGGLNHPGPPTLFHPAPSPYGIPYRSLYSRNIGNLFFAGRNLSATHAAMSSTRVMATCAVCGQAVGTAAALAAAHGLSPRGVYHHRLADLQQALMDDDCYLPWNRRNMPPLTREAELTASTGDPEPLRNGLDRPLDGEDNGWRGPPGAWVQYSFGSPRSVRQVRLVSDSDLSPRTRDTRCNYPLHPTPLTVPPVTLRSFRLDALDGSGNWRTVFRETNNYRRFVRVPLAVETRALRLIPQSTWGAEEVHLFAFDVR